MAPRLARAFAELALSAAVLAAAVVVGHELREWREWYPQQYHPWLGDAPAAERSER